MTPLDKDELEFRAKLASLWLDGQKMFHERGHSPEDALPRMLEALVSLAAMAAKSCGLPEETFMESCEDIARERWARTDDTDEDIEAIVH